MAAKFRVEDVLGDDPGVIVSDADAASRCDRERTRICERQRHVLALAVRLGVGNGQLEASMHLRLLKERWWGRAQPTSNAGRVRAVGTVTLVPPPLGRRLRLSAALLVLAVGLLTGGCTSAAPHPAADATGGAAEPDRPPRAAAPSPDPDAAPHQQPQIAAGL